MAREYRQLTYLERQRIEEALDCGLSFRETARIIGRDASTVSREVRANAQAKEVRCRKAACRHRGWCKRVGVCGPECKRPGAQCVGCDARDCRDHCPAYADQARCDRLARAPWVCNGCRNRRYKCSRPFRRVYLASAADEAARARRSDARVGIDMGREEAELALGLIRDAQKRGMSPYEISVAFAEQIGRSPSTIYRWTEAGYGGLANIDLERKVGFRKRRRTQPRRPTRHSKERSWEAFCALDEEARASRMEMDTVVGLKGDARCLLTLYHAPTHLQLALLLQAKTCEEVKRALGLVRQAAGPSLWEGMSRAVLTDNGEEFADEDGIGRILGEGPKGGGRPRLHYCDPRQSQQKGACEKNHTELRQILAKGAFSFDGLCERDLAVVMSHANSNPRASLAGLSPIQMLKAAHGKLAEALLEAFGVEQVGASELALKPCVLNAERAKRGEEPLEMGC